MHKIPLMTNSIPYPMPTILFHIDVSYWNYHISLSEMPFVSSTRKPMSILYQICKAKTIQGGASDVCRFIKPINYTYIYHKNISTPTVVLVTHQLWSTTANPTSTTQEPSVRPHSGIIPPGRHLQWRDNDVTCNQFFCLLESPNIAFPENERCLVVKKHSSISLLFL